ncbi:NAD(P)-binding protein [Xylariaceae sp. FL0594]|nr:NAD(P)-binding protein [Xylariaceae sp. FL0594]
MASQTVQDEGPADFEGTEAAGLRPPSPPPLSATPPRLLIIGAGSRGRVYARCSLQSSNGVVAAVCEPDDYKRNDFGAKFIWGSHVARKDGEEPPEGTSFKSWHDFVVYEMKRREREASGEEENVPPGVDAAFVCVRDEMHLDVVMALAPLGLHIMCEKPLATTLEACTRIYRALTPLQDTRVFSIGHVMRYSPHNILLRKLLLEDRVIGDVLSVHHTEPVGFWHFAHSYVRGNWRKESITAPSLLTKCCHDIDLILWLLCSPGSQSESANPDSSSPPNGNVNEQAREHLPSYVTSTGSLQYFKKSRKPKAAGAATNCLSCAHEPECLYSSKRVYVSARHQGVETGNVRWPVSVVLPDIESFDGDVGRASEAMLAALAEDYDADTTPQEVIDGRNWFGRCVWESDNDVCDEQVVVISWDEENEEGEDDAAGSRGAKQATIHMVAQTKKQCQRYTHIHGTHGEIFADSTTITVEDFRTGATATHRPRMESLGHGGGDHGLTRQFVLAVDRVKNAGWRAPDAQRRFVGCGLEDIVRSHAMVFAAEEARRERRTVDWRDWWDKNVGAV